MQQHKDLSMVFEAVKKEDRFKDKLSELAVSSAALHGRVKKALRILQAFEEKAKVRAVWMEGELDRAIEILDEAPSKSRSREVDRFWKGFVEELSVGEQNLINTWVLFRKLVGEVEDA